MCGQECDSARGCIEGKSEQGRFLRIVEAKAECFQCDVREQCLDWAIETNQDFGIWGGATERERRKMRSERNRRG